MEASVSKTIKAIKANKQQSSFLFDFWYIFLLKQMGNQSPYLFFFILKAHLFAAKPTREFWHKFLSP